MFSYKEGADSFEYGIGVLVDAETAEFELEEMKKTGYRIWDVKRGTYVVFDCISDTWAKFYKEFLPQMGYESTEATDYEILYPMHIKGYS